MSIELAPGLGEILASATEEGNPYRMIYNKAEKKITINEFAKLSFAFRPDRALSMSSILFIR